MNNGFLRRIERLEGMMHREPELRVFVGPAEDEAEKVRQAAAVYGLTPEQCQIAMLWKMTMEK